MPVSDETKWTPGPWRLQSDPCHYDTLSTVVGGAQQRVPETQTYIRDQMQVEVGGWAGVEEQEANARLIAAAPQLYEALEAASGAMAKLIHEGIDRGKGHWPAWDDCARAVDQARAALASSRSEEGKG